MYEIYTRLDDEQSQRQLLAGRLNMLFRDRRAHAYTRHQLRQKARLSTRGLVGDRLDMVIYYRGEVMSLHTTVLVQMSEIRELHAADRRRQAMISEILKADQRRSTEMRETGDSTTGIGYRTTAIAGTRWRSCTARAARGGCLAMDLRVDLRMKMNECMSKERDDKSSRLELWNLKESDKIERYFGGLPDMIHRNIVASKPKTMQEAVEMATKLMDKKVSTIVERQAENKRKFENTSRNNQNQQQQNKRQNTGRAYTAWTGEKNPYEGSKTLYTKCNYHHDGPCAPKCHKCNKFGHFARDCRSAGNANNANNQRGIGSGQKSTCFECGVHGLFKEGECPKAEEQQKNVLEIKLVMTGLQPECMQWDMQGQTQTPTFSDAIIGMDWLAKYQAIIVVLKRSFVSPEEMENPLVFTLRATLLSIGSFLEMKELSDKQPKELSNKQEHKKHLKLILELLKREELYAKFSKCEFWIPKVQFLGHVIDSEGIHMDPAKIESIKDWASPKSPTEIRQFLGLAGYYRRFIEGFSKIAKPMTKLTQKKVRFVWGDKQEAPFQLLKQKLCSAPILALPEGSWDFIAYCDASKKGLSAVLMQREKSVLAFKDLEAITCMETQVHRCLTVIRAYNTLLSGKRLFPIIKRPSGSFSTTQDTAWKWVNITLWILSLKVLRRSKATTPFWGNDLRSHPTSWEVTSECFNTNLDMSIAYHPQTDGQSERTIQTLEDMLRACVIDFGKVSRSPCFVRTEVGEAQILGPELIQETNREYCPSQSKGSDEMSARDRHKSYADLKHKMIEFQVGDKFMLKVSPWKWVVRWERLILYTVKSELAANVCISRALHYGVNSTRSEIDTKRVSLKKIHWINNILFVS
ncbi:putative reverse transcriptase domain-containing protein [Tanacetum coccineum]